MLNADRKLITKKVDKELRLYGFSFESLNEPVCNNCLDNGKATVTCSECGCSFNPIGAGFSLDLDIMVYGGDRPYKSVLTQENKCLCENCARKYVRFKIEPVDHSQYKGVPANYDVPECVSIDDAARYWVCSGYDPDETYGYTEKQLRKYIEKYGI